MTEQVDIIVIGGGIGGAALATVLARGGQTVLVLEKSSVYRDHVRGEWMAPWGVVELQRLGLYDAVRAAGGHHVSRHLFCDDDMPPADVAAMALDLSSVVQGVPGPLCIGHPQLCQLLIDMAAAAGATVERDVARTEVEPGAAPTVCYRHNGAERRVGERQMEDPTLLLPLMAAFIGPDNIPAEAFDEAVRQRLLMS